MKSLPLLSVPTESAWRCLNVSCRLPTVEFSTNPPKTMRSECPFCGCQSRERIR